MSIQSHGPTKAGSLVDQVMQAVRQQIASREMTPGMRLPSIRGQADRMGVSRSTIVDAYDRLMAEGVIQSRRGSGFYVTGHPPPFSIADTAPELERDVDPLWIARQSLDADGTAPKPGCGWLPRTWMPEEEIRRALRRVARDTDFGLSDYSTSQGLPALRQLLSRRLADRGVIAAPGQIMLTESGTQAIDLLCRFLLQPGDTVLVDDPCYFNFHAMLRAHQVQVVGVPYTPTGPDLPRFEQALKQHAPRLYMTNSALQNPTGATLSPAVAHRVLKLAEAHGLIIIEDDIFADFEHEPAPRLAAFDGLDRVIHIGSFSKSLSAAIRTGFIAARPDWTSELVDLRIATSFGGGALSAELVLAVLQDGAWRRHTSGLRTRLATAMETVSRRLGSLGMKPWIEPGAGMFLWCRLPDGLDAADVARAALRQSIVLAPGNAFSLGQDASGFMRFNVAQTLDPGIIPAIERAMQQARNTGSGISQASP
ncbi:MAG: PLP-dependent aminotransferase family protein [Minwuia sp.]|nr:PLP-dependent aminotransferase family protein [Minwuia sp.]